VADLTLDVDKVASTIDLLRRRVQERFPDSGLARVCGELDRIAEQTRERAAWIAKPILGLRIASGALVALILAGLAVTLASLRAPSEGFNLIAFIQVLESGINDVVLIGAAVFFLVTIETRIKRGRALAAIRELRALAHIIDMHQLTKDPEWLFARGETSELLPRRRMTRFELSRYLDYCTEALSLTAKLAALYIQGFDDDVALAAVDEIESLTNGLSRKIWQKLMILHALEPETPA